MRLSHHAPPTPVRTTGGAAPARADAGVARAPRLAGVVADAATPIAEKGARMLHGDARHTHRAAGHGPHAPNVVWTADVGGPVEAQVTASPDEQTLYVASLDGALTALARDDGAKIWSVALGDRAYGAPCVGDDGTIYEGSDAKRFRAIDPKGNVVWTIETDGEADTGAALGDGKIVFAAGATVYAARRGGDLAWRFSAKGKVFSAPAIGPSGLVTFGSQDHHVYAVGLATGKLAWSVDLGADVDAATAIGDSGQIYVGTDGDEIVRLEADGTIAWRTNVGGFVRGALSVARNGDVLAGVYGPLPREVRLDGATGAIRGELAVQGTGAREFGVHGGALEDDQGTLYFGAQDDRVYAVDASGETRWTLAMGGDVDAPATLLSDGALVLASDDGKVVLVRTP